jgi:hypothetical protein
MHLMLKIDSNRSKKYVILLTFDTSLELKSQFLTFNAKFVMH